MKAVPSICCALMTLLATPCFATGNLDYVNPFIGTDGKNPREYGGMMPFVVPPFGMTSWTPQTRQNKISRTSYRYSDSMISGFMGTHQPAIWMGDFGYVTVMPEVDWIKTTPEARQLPFSHTNETATPYCYSVTMDAGAERTIRTEVTATERCALLQITYPECKKSSLLMEATRPGVAGFASVDPDKRELTGYNPDRMDAHLTTLKLPNLKGYFVVQFSKPFQTCGTYLGDDIKEGRLLATGTNAGSFASFATTANEVVTVRIGTSFISIDQARANLKAELGEADFPTAMNRLKNIWADKLNLIAIEGGSRDQLVQFYTGMYHCLQYPRLFSEHGKYYSAFDDTIHEGVSYTAYSLWDVFRAEFSFITLFAPEHVDAMVQALLQNFHEGGWMPKWPNPTYTSIMLGTHADSLVAESITKGFHGFDVNLAWQAVYKDAMTPPNGDETHKWGDRCVGDPYAAREGLTWYKKFGYVPNDRTARAASNTLEGAYDDWCVAQVAKAVGRTDDYRFFLERSRNYRNLYNSSTGELQSRNADGSWPPSNQGWTEGGRQQNIFAVWHDIPGLIELMGGPVKFRLKLDQNPADMSNEPGQHWPYLYDYCGQPSETQKLVRRGLSQGYANTPVGLPGNDDCGQTSAWWLFTAMGFYPVHPASGEYMIGSPLFPQVSFKLQNGKTFTVEAPNTSAENIYIQSATLNGEALNKPVITWAQIQAGGTLHFDMGNTPSAWGADWSGKKVE